MSPWDRGRYPPQWEAMRADVLERAGNRCEGSPAFPDCRAANGEPHPVTGSRVVLTIAHLDHDPETCRDLVRLRAWCQRCHLKYDHHRHMRKGRETRRGRKACGDLFTSAPE